MAKHNKPDMSAGKFAQQNEKNPTPQEINALVAQFNEAKYAELATLAYALTVRYPRHAFGWMMLGVAFSQTGRNNEALPHIQRAAALSPSDAGVHCNLGKMLLELGRRAEAEKSFRRALKIKPDFAMAHSNLGQTLRGLGRGEEAEVCFRRALKLKPDFAEVYGNLGALLKDQGKLDAALVCFQQQVKLTPENREAQHLLASLSGINTERAPTQYVENLFDGFAENFDKHLMQVLNYDVPEKLVTLATEYSTPSVEKWNVLDLGCGTGLIGSKIAPFARQLVGVDLSGKMLEKAHARNLYQRLERSDLLTMMRGEKTSSYDVIVAADVFIYVGKLDEICGEIKRLLSPGGLVAFSIETLEELPSKEISQNVQREYQLENTSRYTHSVSYIIKLAVANGFITQEMVPTQIRMERDKPVNGYLVLWKS